MPWDSNKAEFCRKLVAAFYARVPADPVLSLVYPKHLACAIQSLTLFLTETLGGPRDYSTDRQWLTLGEAHQRFQLGPPQREAWLRNMNEVITELQGPAELREYFEQVSAYLIGQECGPPGPLWQGQHATEEAIAAVRAGDAAKALELAERARPKTNLLLAAFGDSGNPDLVAYARDQIVADPSLAHAKLLHKVSEPSLIRLLLQQGADPNAVDALGRPPLYFAVRAEAVHALAAGGAKVNARSGVQQVTPLHRAARSGNIPAAQALLDCGADPSLRDKAGATPLQRAVNCRKHEMAAFFRSRGITM